MRLREFKERQRLDENPFALPWILGLLGLSAGATLSQPKIEKWVKDNPGEAKNFSDGIKKVVPDGNPQAITNPIGNALVKSWNWLTNGETQKDSVIKNQPPLSVPFKDRPKKDKTTIQNKITYDQYLNTVGQKAKPVPPKVIQNIRSSGDAGAGWAKQYDDLYKKRSQVNKQIAADIKNGMTKDQLDSKYGDNLKNINRDLNDHLGKVDDYGKGLKPLQKRDVKTYPVKPLVIKNIDDNTVEIDGKTYDKDFDKEKIADIKRRQRGSYVPPTNIDTKIGSKNKSTVLDPEIILPGDRGKDGGIVGNPGVGGEIDGTGSAGVKPEVIPGTDTGTKGEVIPGTTTGTVANTITGNPAVPIARTTTVPPGFIPPPIAQLPKVVPLAKQTRKYDPKKDTDIIYKGKVAPDAVSKFKATKSNPQKNKDYYKKLLKKFS